MHETYVPNLMLGDQRICSDVHVRGMGAYDRSSYWSAVRAVASSGRSGATLECMAIIRRLASISRTFRSCRRSVVLATVLCAYFAFDSDRKSTRLNSSHVAL